MLELGKIAETLVIVVCFVVLTAAFYKFVND
jgi:hypothetical protein